MSDARQHQSFCIYLHCRALAAAGAALFATLGCGPATGGDAEYWAPYTSVPESQGEGGAGGGGSGDSSTAGSQASSSSGAGPSPTGAPKLTLAFTTASFGGEYSPKNIGAVWVTDAQDVFVKTLHVWAGKRIKYLSKWRAASNENMVDAITSATWKQHGKHSLVWEMTYANGQAITDGAYHVYIELTEKNGAGKWTSIDVTKGQEPITLMPPDEPTFLEQSLVYSP